LNDEPQRGLAGRVQIDHNIEIIPLLWYSIPIRPSVALELHREEIRRIVESHRGLNPRVFGSALRGDDTEDSDLDLLIDPGEGLGFLGVAKIALAIGEITKTRVDVRTPGDLAEWFRAKVVAEAKPV
jgi:predicted nucleotidyltransferase